MMTNYEQLHEQTTLLPLRNDVKSTTTRCASVFLLAALVVVLAAMLTYAVVLRPNQPQEDSMMAMELLMVDGAANNPRSLLLLRHAKSSWEDSSWDDFDRPLADEGCWAALQLGHRLLQKENLEPPSVIYASPSKRTVQTLALLRRDGWAANVPVVFDDRLYNFDVNATTAGAEAYLDVITRSFGDERRVMIVGHNPPIGALVQLLLPNFQKFPPGTFCEIDWTDLDAWNRLQAEKATLGLLVRPKKNHDIHS